MSYWGGVITGFFCTLVLASLTLFIHVSQLRSMEERLGEIEREHEELLEWVEDNKTVMQTYKFFNQSWQAIIDMRKEQ